MNSKEVPAHTFKLPLILVPAYGRVYKSKESALADWNNNKDFKIESGPYCSKQDYKTMLKHSNVISIRYGQGLYVQVTGE